MAESAGLGDSERVSEEVPDAAAEPAEDGSAGEERPRDDGRAVAPRAEPDRAEDVSEKPAEAAETPVEEAAAGTVESDPAPVEAAEPGEGAADARDDDAGQAEANPRRRRRR